jgi:hypothetical protein
MCPRRGREEEGALTRHGDVPCEAPISIDRAAPTGALPGSSAYCEAAVNDFFKRFT